MAKVGLGVIIVNSDGKVLVGKRKNIIAPFYSIPGGGLDDGETFEDGAKREILEETSLILNKIEVIGLTNNLETYKKEKFHSVSVVLFCDDFSGEPKLLEPDKCEGWSWEDPENLPLPHFDASKMAIENYLEKRFYHKHH
ncbi:NUDIX domain-containing protein [Candidatus Woesearchaeota archaeon]|nr:NUDIX domain-containing protein [Candidatus Woesearchaeota archaeon]